VFVNDVDSVHDELAGRGAKVIKAPQNYDYGMRDFDVIDLDGNHLTFGMEAPHSEGRLWGHQKPSISDSGGPIAARNAAVGSSSRTGHPDAAVDAGLRRRRENRFGDSTEQP
jgi:hypothetical protein